MRNKHVNLFCYILYLKKKFNKKKIIHFSFWSILHAIVGMRIAYIYSVNWIRTTYDAERCIKLKFKTKYYKEFYRMCGVFFMLDVRRRRRICTMRARVTYCRYQRASFPRGPLMNYWYCSRWKNVTINNVISTAQTDSTSIYPLYYVSQWSARHLRNVYRGDWRQFCISIMLRIYNNLIYPIHGFSSTIPNYFISVLSLR